eukprot:m.38017 g.38017  ORF g.38017 m.38017 type:complete len:597 (+) comp17814_c0_seq2:316-2106(+)
MMCSLQNLVIVSLMFAFCTAQTQSQPQISTPQKTNGRSPEPSTSQSNIVRNVSETDLNITEDSGGSEGYFGSVKTWIVITSSVGGFVLLCAMVTAVSCRRRRHRLQWNDHPKPAMDIVVDDIIHEMDYEYEFEIEKPEREPGTRITETEFSPSRLNSRQPSNQSVTSTYIEILPTAGGESIPKSISTIGEYLDLGAISPLSDTSRDTHSEACSPRQRLLDVDYADIDPDLTRALATALQSHQRDRLSSMSSMGSTSTVDRTPPRTPRQSRKQSRQRQRAPSNIHHLDEPQPQHRLQLQSSNHIAQHPSGLRSSSISSFLADEVERIPRLVQGISELDQDSMDYSSEVENGHHGPLTKRTSLSSIASTSSYWTIGPDMETISTRLTHIHGRVVEGCGEDAIYIVDLSRERATAALRVLSPSDGSFVLRRDETLHTRTDSLFLSYLYAFKIHHCPIYIRSDQYFIGLRPFPTLTSLIEYYKCHIDDNMKCYLSRQCRLDGQSLHPKKARESAYDSEDELLCAELLDELENMSGARDDGANGVGGYNQVRHTSSGEGGRHERDHFPSSNYSIHGVDVDRLSTRSSLVNLSPMSHSVGDF